MLILSPLQLFPHAYVIPLTDLAVYKRELVLNVHKPITINFPPEMHMITMNIATKSVKSHD